MKDIVVHVNEFVSSDFYWEAREKGYRFEEIKDGYEKVIFGNNLVGLVTVGDGLRVETDNRGLAKIARKYIENVNAPFQKSFDKLQEGFLEGYKKTRALDCNFRAQKNL